MVHDEIAYASVDLYEREVSCHVVVHYSGVLVGKCSKTKNIGYGCIAIIWDDITSQMFWDKRIDILIPWVLRYDWWYNWWYYWNVDGGLDFLRCCRFLGRRAA